MKTLITFAVLLSCSYAHALDSTMSISLSELKKHETIVGLSGGDDNQMLMAGSRILQLQLRASNCEKVIIVPTSMTVSEKNEFLIKSDNCVIKEKKDQSCEAGYVARNISANPNSSEDPIVGADKYKVCVKDSGKDSKKSEPAKQSIQ